MTQQDPYRPPNEVPQPRGIGPLAAIGIAMVTLVSTVATFVGTCFPAGMMLFDPYTPGPMWGAIIAAGVCALIAITVGFLVARSMVRRQRELHAEEFAKEHGDPQSLPQERSADDA